MPRRCTVCAHPEVEAINRALVGGALPYRAGVPTPESLTPRPGGPELTGRGAGVRKHLERWGMAEDWDKMQREGERKRAWKLRERRALEELERQANPFGIGTAYPTDTTSGARTRRKEERGQWERENSWM